MKKIRSDIGAIIGIVFIVCVFFWQIALGKLPVPTDALVGLYHPWRDFYTSQYPNGVPFKNFLITDPVRQQIPWRKVVIENWKRGEIPLWNPYNFSGASLVGNIQAAVFYPLNILFFVLHFPVAWTILIVLQPLLAAIFLYAYLRNNNLSIGAGLFGAVIWAFSGFMIAWMTWGTIDHVVLWLPLILFCIDKLKRKSILWSVVLVCALVFSQLAGHAQMALYVMLLASVIAVWKGIKNYWMPLIISIVIALVQWIPFVQTLLASSRAIPVDNWKNAGWFLPWQHLAQFFAPDYFGNPATLNYWGEWNYGEFVGYIGIIGIIFTTYALFLIKKSVQIKFWGIVLGVTLLLVLPTPVGMLPFILNLPILSSLQPTRLIAIVDFALVMLAVFGFEEWQKSRDKRVWLALGVTGAIFILLWAVTIFLAPQFVDVTRRNLILPSVFAGLTALVIAIASVSRRKIVMSSAVVILVLVAAADLFRFGWKFTPFTTGDYFFPKTAVIEFLQKQQVPFRVMSLDQRILPPNTLAYYGIESIEGYDPVYSQRYEEFFAALTRRNPDINRPFGFNRILTSEFIDSPLVRFMNVRFVLTLSDIQSPFLEKVFEEGQTRVYLYQQEMPRAYLVERIEVASANTEAIRLLYEQTDQGDKAVLEQHIDIQSAPIDTSEEVRLLSYGASHLTLITQTSVDRFLVVSNVFDPGWIARVDGNITPLYKTNYIFQGLVVPSGTHEVTLQYKYL